MLSGVYVPVPLDYLVLCSLYHVKLTIFNSTKVINANHKYFHKFG